VYPNKISKNKEGLLAVVKSFLWEDKVMMLIIYSALFLNLSVWIGLYFLLRKETEIFIAHYNVFFGIDFLIDIANGENRWQLLWVPAGGLLFWFLSFLLAVFLRKQFPATVQNKMSKKMPGELISNRSIGLVGGRLLLIGAWCLQVILLVYLLAIYRINGGF